MDNKSKIVISSSFGRERNLKDIRVAIKDLEDLGIEILSLRVSKISNLGVNF